MAIKETEKGERRQYVELKSRPLQKTLCFIWRDRKNQRDRLSTDGMASKMIISISYCEADDLKISWKFYFIFCVPETKRLLIFSNSTSARSN